jgi:hypothetical protein
MFQALLALKSVVAIRATTRLLDPCVTAATSALAADELAAWVDAAT